MRVSIGPAYRRYWGGRDVHEDIRAALPSGSTGETSIWVGDVGRDPPHVEEPGGGYPPGGETDQGTNPPPPSQRELELSSIGGGNAGSVARGDVGIYWEAS